MELLDQSQCGSAVPSSKVNLHDPHASIVLSTLRNCPPTLISLNLMFANIESSLIWTTHINLPVCLFIGIGIGMLCVSMLVCLYYNVIIAWTFYYLGSSFQSPLPWSCDAPANAYLCGNATLNSSSGRALSPSEVFWK